MSSGDQRLIVCCCMVRDLVLVASLVTSFLWPSTLLGPGAIWFS